MEQQYRKDFLDSEMFLLLQQLEETATPLWGKMNAQQMVEHLTDFFKVSVEKLVFPLTTPEEHLPRYREFLYSEKMFRENTKAPAEVLGEIPLPMRNDTFQSAKEKLGQAVTAFFKFYQQQPGHKTLHPVFGMLDFDEWVMLHYKHVTHHFRQFDILRSH